MACLEAFEALKNNPGDGAAEKRREAAEKRRALITSSEDPGSPKWRDCSAAITDICAKAARHEIEDSEKVLAHIDTCLKERRAELMAAPAGAAVGAEIVRSIAQVVVTKAQAAGWGLLKERLEELAHCPKDKTGNSLETKQEKFPNTCNVLDSLTIKDLVSSPTVLLDAVIGDLLKDINDPVAGKVINDATPLVGAAILDAAARWPQSGGNGIARAFRQAVLDRIVKEPKGSCSNTDTIPKKYVYVAVMCFAQFNPKQVSSCDAGQLIEACVSGERAIEKKDKDRAELRRLWDLTTALFPPSPQQPKPIDAVNLGFAIGQDELDVWKEQKGGKTPTQKQKQQAQDIFAGTKDLVSGLVQKDWVSATSGGVRILETFANSTGVDVEKCDERDASCKSAKVVWDGARLFRILAAVGNYALTFDKSQNPDPKEAAAAREKIITELVDRMVNRTDRESGAVVSLGGTLGIFGGARFAKTDKFRGDFAFPVQLTLGVGVQTYGRGTGGFHGMLSAVDLGQYVNMNDPGALQVDKPDFKSALALGITAGYWFALRETPLHIALHAAVAPFNRADGKPTFQAGAVFGIYVPLLDFN
ncbi:MAG: hypothetical protein PHU25_14100 [Deltaproteobacteria bacterium]|nr:hypothetical protein [Deltaproteobacteria bacterium]